jgi:hypothetical protein
MTIRINGGMTNNPQGLAHNQARIAALGTVASEVEARIVDMEKAIATLK